jgi:hypothetical protein
VSDPQTPPPDPQLKKLGGCATAFLMLVGIVMVLPGLCSLGFLAFSLTTGGVTSDIVSLWVLTFVLAGVGIVLIRWTAKH